MEWRPIVLLAARECDVFALKITYRDADGSVTRRIVSPIKMTGPDRFDALCLCRQEPRTFLFKGVIDAVLIHASEVLAPVEVEVLSGEDVERVEAE